MRGRLGDEGELSLSQYHLLEPLIDDERLATCELALAAGVSAPTATRMLSGLERDGPRRARAVHRRPARGPRRPHRRRARPRAAPSAPAARRAAPRSSRSLSAGERREAARLLERLAAAIEGLR